MLVTPTIKDALKKAANYYGNPATLAKAIGVAHSTVFFWLSGKTESVSGKVWTNKVLPVIAPFMTPEQRRQVGLNEPYSKQPNGPRVDMLREFSTEVKYVAQDGRRAQNICAMKPVSGKPYALIPFGVLANLDTSILPLSTFICRERIGETRFSLERRRGFFGVRTESKETSGFEPRTELLLSSCDLPQEGDLVVVRFRDDGAVVVGNYHRENEWITVSSILNPEDVRTWDCKKNLGYMLWCYPVFEAKRSYRAFTDIYEEGDGEGY